jgi:hypothetical protein
MWWAVAATHSKQLKVRAAAGVALSSRAPRLPIRAGAMIFEKREEAFLKDPGPLVRVGWGWSSAIGEQHSSR